MDTPALSYRGGAFKIMQIADAQEFPVVSPDTVRLIETALQAERPDLVIFTGDQVYGITPRLWNETRVKHVIGSLLAPVTAAGVPFAVTFGNHDAESGFSNPELAAFYGAYPGYLSGERRSEDDPGTFRLPVYGSDGSLKLSVYAFDTHGSAPAGGMGGVNESQLAWFARARENERDGAGKKPPALVFQHIPVPEYYNVINKINRRKRGAVEAYGGARKHTFYALPEELKAAGGFMKESPSTGGAGEFEALKEDGGVLALAVGHDHNNSFVGEYEGVKLIYTQGAGFHVYGPHLKRGVRLFTLNESDSAAFTTYTRTWESLTDKKPKEYPVELFLSHTPSSVSQGMAWARRASLPLAAAGAAAAAFIVIKRKSK